MQLVVVIFKRIFTVERIRNGRGREGGYHVTPLFFFAVFSLPSRVGDHQPGPTLSGGGPDGGRALARGGSNPSPSARRISSVKATPLLFTELSTHLILGNLASDEPSSWKLKGHNNDLASLDSEHTRIPNRGPVTSVSGFCLARMDEKASSDRPKWPYLCHRPLRRGALRAGSQDRR